MMRPMPSSPYTTHAALRGNKIGLADVMAFLFLPDDGSQINGKVFVARVATQAGAEIVLDDAEETSADFSVGGEAQAVAMAAEGFADWGDEAEFASAISKDPALRCFGGI